MKIAVFIVTCLFISLNGFSQFSVGKTQNEVKADEAKKTPVLIGSNKNLLTLNYGLYHIEADNSEYLACRTTIGSFQNLNFSSSKEETDFYNYILDLYDNFKDNEIMLGKIKIVPQKNNLLGNNSLVFDIYPDVSNKSYKFTTYLIGKAGWVKLFVKANIHTSGK